MKLVAYAWHKSSRLFVPACKGATLLGFGTVGLWVFLMRHTSGVGGCEEVSLALGPAF